jgi:hypothetical protein
MLTKCHSYETNFFIEFIEFIEKSKTFFSINSINFSKNGHSSGRALMIYPSI